MSERLTDFLWRLTPSDHRPESVNARIREQAIAARNDPIRRAKAETSANWMGALAPILLAAEIGGSYAFIQHVTDPRPPIDTPTLKIAGKKAATSAKVQEALKIYHLPIPPEKVD